MCVTNLKRIQLERYEVEGHNMAGRYTARYPCAPLLFSPSSRSVYAPVATYSTSLPEESVEHRLEFLDQDGSLEVLGNLGESVCVCACVCVCVVCVRVCELII